MSRMDDILNEISDGAVDGRFNEVYEALAARETLLNALNMQNMRVGARVVTTGICKPVHRQLKWATVEELKPRSGKVAIRFDDDSRRWTWPARDLAVQQQQVTA